MVLGSYFLTMGKVTVFYDLEMEFKIFLGQILINGFVNYKSKYFFLWLHIFLLPFNKLRNITVNKAYIEVFILYLS